MKKIVPFLLLVFVLSCSKSEDDTPDNALTTYYIELDNVVTERLTINQITLPNYVFYPTSQQQTFTLDKGMPSGLNNIRVTLSGKCSVGNRDVSQDVFVNFLEDKPTVVFSISRVNTCGAIIVTSYK